MKLQNLSDAELGRIVRESPLWKILLNMEEKESPVDAGPGKEHRIGLLCSK